MSDWQPIDTAPENGILLLWEPSHVPYVGYRSIHGDGWTVVSNSRITPSQCNPSHWMELPEPPHLRELLGDE